ncbi:MAG: DMT family transporter [Phycisphaerales bacterium]|nr:DMT family transporter [Phycisphaerales bacterium]
MGKEGSTTSGGTTGGVVLVVLTLLGWSVVPLFLRHFATLIDTWTSNGWRYGLSALMWLPLVLVAASRKKLPKGVWMLALVPSIFNALGQTFFTWAHYKIPASLLTFGLRSHIVFVAIGAAILFPAERRIIRTPGFIVGVLLVLMGTLGTIVSDKGFGTGATTTGVLMAIAAGALFSGYALGVRKFMHGINSLVSFAVISQYTAIVMVACMLTLGERAGVTAIEMGGVQFGLLVLSAIIGIALGHVFYYMSIARLGVAVSSGVLQVQPIVVGVLSAIVLGESLRAVQWITGVVAVLGAGLILWTQHDTMRRMREESASTAGHIPQAGGDLAEFRDLPPDHVAAAIVGEDTSNDK